jgi:hypothetical protein
MSENKTGKSKKEKIGENLKKLNQSWSIFKARQLALGTGFLIRCWRKDN